MSQLNSAWVDQMLKLHNEGVEARGSFKTCEAPCPFAGGTWFEAALHLVGRQRRLEVFEKCGLV